MILEMYLGTSLNLYMSEYQQDVFYSSTTTCVVLKKVYQKSKDNILIDNKLDYNSKKLTVNH